VRGSHPQASAPQALCHRLSAVDERESGTDAGAGGDHPHSGTEHQPASHRRDPRCARKQAVERSPARPLAPAHRVGEQSDLLGRHLAVEHALEGFRATWAGAGACSQRSCCSALGPLPEPASSSPPDLLGSIASFCAVVSTAVPIAPAATPRASAPRGESVTWQVRAAHRACRKRRCASSIAAVASLRRSSRSRLLDDRDHPESA
jgi:hypothetical protein